MQINLPHDAEIIVLQKAAAAGFGEDVTAYVAHLISADEPTEDCAPLADDQLKASLDLIRRGEDDIASGRTQPLREALEEIAETNGLNITK
jgi:hypothetical protein